MSTLREIVEILRRKQSGAAILADQAALEALAEAHDGGPDEVREKMLDAARHSAAERAFGECIVTILLDAHDARTKVAR